MPWIISPSYVILSSYISFPGSRVTSQIGIFPSLLRNYKIFLSKESHLLSLDNSPSLSFPLLSSYMHVCVCVILLYFADSNRSWVCTGYTDFVSEGSIGGIYRSTWEWKESDFVVRRFLKWIGHCSGVESNETFFKLFEAILGSKGRGREGFLG